MGYTSKKVIFHLKLKFPTFCVGNSLQFFFPIRPSKSLQLGKFPTYRNTGASKATTVTITTNNTTQQEHCLPWTILELEAGATQPNSATANTLVAIMLRTS